MIRGKTFYIKGKTLNGTIGERPIHYRERDLHGEKTFLEWGSDSGGHQFWCLNC